MMVSVLVDLLAERIIGIVPGFNVDALADVNTNMSTATITELEFTVSLEDPLRFCLAARSCWRIAALDCPCFLQTRTPSYHVCTTCVLPVPAQFPNQEPPRPQQLSLPDFRIVPHLAQTELMVFVVATACWHVEHSHSQTRKKKRSTKKKSRKHKRRTKKKSRRKKR